MGAAIRVQQELIDIDQTGPRNDPFVAQVVIFRIQVLSEFVLQRRAGAVVGVATFGWDRDVTRTIPKQTSLAQSGARRDDGAVPRRFRVAGIGQIEIAFFQSRDPIAIGFQVIDHGDVRDVGIGSQFGRIDDPA